MSATTIALLLTAGSKGGLLLGNHRRDLTLRRAVNARIGPVRFPAIEIRLRLVE